MAHTDYKSLQQYQFEIIPLKSWSRNPHSLPGGDSFLATPVDNLVVSWTDTPPCTSRKSCYEALRDLQKQNREKGLPDFKHNFFIGGDGNVYEGLGWCFLSSDSPAYATEKSVEVKNTVNAAIIDKDGVGPAVAHFTALGGLIAKGQKGNFLKPKFTLYWSKKGKLEKARIFSIMPGKLKGLGQVK